MVTLTPQLETLEFDPVKQLVPITNVGTGAQVIGDQTSLPAKNLPEFLAYAKANPGKFNFSVAGTQISATFLRCGCSRRPGRSGHGAGARRTAGDFRSDERRADLYFGNASALLPLANTTRSG